MEVDVDSTSDRTDLLQVIGIPNGIAARTTLKAFLRAFLSTNVTWPPPDPNTKMLLTMRKRNTSIGRQWMLLCRRKLRNIMNRPIHQSRHRLWNSDLPLVVLSKYHAAAVMLSMRSVIFIKLTPLDNVRSGTRVPIDNLRVARRSRLLGAGGGARVKHNYALHGKHRTLQDCEQRGRMGRLLLSTFLTSLLTYPRVV